MRGFHMLDSLLLSRGDGMIYEMPWCVIELAGRNFMPRYAASFYYLVEPLRVRRWRQEGVTPQFDVAAQPTAARRAGYDEVRFRYTTPSRKINISFYKQFSRSTISFIWPARLQEKIPASRLPVAVGTEDALSVSADIAMPFCTLAEIHLHFQHDALASYIRRMPAGTRRAVPRHACAA